jgi:hypothetical protein
MKSYTKPVPNRIALFAHFFFYPPPKPYRRKTKDSRPKKNEQQMAEEYRTRNSELRSEMLRCSKGQRDGEKFVNFLLRKRRSNTIDKNGGEITANKIRITEILNVSAQTESL